MFCNIKEQNSSVLKGLNCLLIYSMLILCGVSLRDKITSVMLRERMGVEAIGVVVKRNRLRWFGHVERNDDCDWVKGCTVLEVEGTRPRGRPKKKWMEVVKRDMKEMGLRREDALDRVEWQRRLKGGPANPSEPGNRAVKPYLCVCVFSR